MDVFLDCKFSARLLLLPPPCQLCSLPLIPGCSRRTRYRCGKGSGEKKRGESRQRLYLRRILILVSSQTVCPDTSLVSSHRRCLVVSLPSEHAVNDLKRAVSPWKWFRRVKTKALPPAHPRFLPKLSALVPPSSHLTAVAWWSRYHQNTWSTI